MKSKAIVIGNNHDNTLNVIRALGSDGFDVELLLLSKSKKNYITKSKYINKTRLFEHESDLLQYLSETARCEKIPVITTSDSIAALIDRNFNMLKTKYQLPNCHNSAGYLIKEMDKERMTQVAQKCGFLVPKTISYRRNTPPQCNLLKYSELHYPVIIKPEQSILGSKDDFRICGSFDCLASTINRDLKHINAFLIQEFIPNDEVLLVAGARTLDGHVYQKGHINKSKHGKRLTNLGMNSLGILTSEDILKDNCCRYLSEIGYFGPYSFEFIRHNGLIYFIEVNLRTDGLYFFFNHFGFNIPSIWASNGEKTCSRRERRLRYKVVGMCEFQYLKNYLSLSHIFSNIRDFANTDVFSIASLKDIKPFIYKILYHRYET